MTSRVWRRAQFTGSVSHGNIGDFSTVRFIVAGILHRLMISSSLMFMLKFDFKFVSLLNFYPLFKNEY